jgi:hypothetical protein
VSDSDVVSTLLLVHENTCCGVVDVLCCYSRGAGDGREVMVDSETCGDVREMQMPQREG